MNIILRLFLLTLTLLLPLASNATNDYYPPPGNWQRTNP